jgi:CubicO group peptidase (beta-lactamase class C family)
MLFLGLLLTLTVACGGSTQGVPISDAGPGADSPDALGAADIREDAIPSACAVLDFAGFDETVAAFVASQGLRGASAVVVHQACGMVHTRGYGSFTSDRVYLVGSSSKVVSAGVIMRLADQSLLDVDAPVGTYLTAWGPKGKPELTLAQMLSNSSGLVGLVDNPLYRPYACQYRAVGTLADCAAAIYGADDGATRVPADTAFHYGGGQWQLAGGVAEVVAGKGWAELVRDTYAPCGLTSLGYTNPFGQAGATGSPFAYPASFDGDARTLPVTSNPSIEGGMAISAVDYGKILLMHLRGGLCEGGRVLSAAAVERMRSDRILSVYGGSTAGQTGRLSVGRTGADNGAVAFAGYGLGWWIDRARPGIVADPGLYGAFPWLDLNRGYAALVAIEADGTVGTELFAAAKPVLDRAFDQARP